jgi:tetratricopeptide (TPR) repeat protein
MEGRWRLGLVGGFVAGLMGCTTTQKPAIVPATPPVQTAANAVYVPEPTDDSSVKEGPLAATTLIVFANTWVESVARDPSKPAAERDRLLSQARQTYQDVLRREPKNVEALLGLGQLYQVTGETEKLHEIEQRATTLHAKNAKVWAWVAVQQGQAKAWDAAAESYHKAVLLDPENRMNRIHLGFTLARGKRYPEAFEWLSRTMREAEARYNLAMMMIHNGDTDKAQMELRLCVRADPNMSSARDQLMAMAAGPDVRTVGHSE